MALMVKELPANTGDTGLIPWSGRSPEGGHGNPLQYSCLENPMARGAWRAVVHGVTKSRTQLKKLSMQARYWEIDINIGLISSIMPHLWSSWHFPRMIIVRRRGRQSYGVRSGGCGAYSRPDTQFSSRSSSSRNWKSLAQSQWAGGLAWQGWGDWRKRGSPLGPAADGTGPMTGSGRRELPARDLKVEDSLPGLPLFNLFCLIWKYDLPGTALDRTEENSSSLGLSTILKRVMGTCGFGTANRRGQIEKTWAWAHLPACKLLK